MRYNTRLSDAIHILAYIDLRGDLKPSSSVIAESLNTNASVVRQILQVLKIAKLTVSQQGVSGTTLAKPAKDISVFDIYQAVSPSSLIKVDHDTNLKCSVGGNIQPVLEEKFNQIINAAEVKMRNITLADIEHEIILGSKTNERTPTLPG